MEQEVRCIRRCAQGKVSDSDSCMAGARAGSQWWARILHFIDGWASHASIVPSLPAACRSQPPGQPVESPVGLGAGLGGLGGLLGQSEEPEQEHAAALLALEVSGCMHRHMLVSTMAPSNPGTPIIFFRVIIAT